MREEREQLYCEAIPADPASLKRFRQAIEATASLAGFSRLERDNMVLAVDEACTNIIRHSYGNDPTGEIRLLIYRNPEGLLFELQDDAPAVDPGRWQPRDLDDLRPGGLGVHFIRNIMDEVAYLECPEGGNRLQMIKYLSDGGDSDELSS